LPLAIMLRCFAVVEVKGNIHHRISMSLGLRRDRALRFNAEATLMSNETSARDRARGLQ